MSALLRLFGCVSWYCDDCLSARLSSFSNNSPRDLYISGTAGLSSCQPDDPPYTATYFTCTNCNPASYTQPNGTLACTEAPPSESPTSRPSRIPSVLPTVVPSKLPTSQPSAGPTVLPSQVPSDLPSTQPSQIPTRIPSPRPTLVSRWYWYPPCDDLVYL